MEETSKYWLDVIQSVAVFITMWATVYTLYLTTMQMKLIRIQMKKNNRVFKSQVFSNLYQRLDTINSLAIQKPEVLQNYLGEYKHDRDEHNPINSYIDMVGTFFYEMFYHHKSNLLSLEEWNSWHHTIKKFYSYPYVMGYWEKHRPEYSGGFDTYLENTISEIKARQEFKREQHK